MAYIIVLDDGRSIEQKHKVELISNSSWLSFYYLIDCSLKIRSNITIFVGIRRQNIANVVFFVR